MGESDVLWSLIESTWDIDSEKRPQFSELRKDLNAELQRLITVDALTLSVKCICYHVLYYYYLV